jgi:BirA family biotin operon repressor/biotin-[acetyl-CoA-carboxylase] ligase
MPTAGERILGWLRESGTPLSGEELARRLGCSRTAVWKHIATLRDAGYEISGQRSAGYTLDTTPDRVSLAELAPHLTGGWREIVWHAEIDSTQRVARELARDGADEGTTVIAESQTGGRGRLGRTWHSPPGVNLYASIILRPPLPPPAVPQIALVAGLAVADAVVASTGLAPRLKWPNDVLVDGRTVAGILTEMEAEMERVHHVIAGIGVNVNVDAFPDDLVAKATSLRLASGRRVDRAAFAAGLLAAFEARYGRVQADGFSAMRGEWEACSSLTGKEVRVAASDGEVMGRVLGLDDDGALRLEGPPGTVRRIVAGEVTLPGGYEG